MFLRLPPNRACTFAMHTAFHMRVLSTGNGRPARRAQDDGLAPPARSFPDYQRPTSQVSNATEVMHLERPRRAAACFASASIQPVDQVIRVSDPPRTSCDIVNSSTYPKGSCEVLQPPQFDCAKLAPDYRTNLVVRAFPQTGHGPRPRRSMSQRQRLDEAAEHNKLQHSQGAFVVIGKRVIVRKTTEL